MFKTLKRAYGGGYRAGRIGEIAYARKVGSVGNGQDIYWQFPGALNPYRSLRGPVGWLLRNIWEAARLNGLRERVTTNRRA